jgi:hypothetical protein
MFKQSELKTPRSKKELLTLNGRFVWLREFIATNIGEEVAEFFFQYHEMNDKIK